MKQFLIFVTKEFRHILRDKRTMLILVVMPVVMIILFGFAITTEVKNSRVAILDYSKDEVTAQIVEHIAHNRYFSIVKDLDNESEAERMFLQNEADMVIAFSQDFASEMKKSGLAKVQILTDGTEPNQASVRTGYMQQVLATYQQQAAQQGLGRLPFRIEPVTRFLYNPQSKSEYNFVPGVIGLILLLICAMMTSIAIVKEKEMGTMEILLASPLPPIVIVLAKLVPYFVISCMNLTTILILSTTLLHIPIAGSVAGFVSITMLYILVSLLIGLLISTCVGSQLAAMLLSLLLIVPTVYLSGITFPIESMPVTLQHVSAIVPARWYVDIARRLMIQGVPVGYVMRETAILGVMALLLLMVSWKMFKTRL
ncbi:MAG: ABC transporter permease [Prevotella sp.]